MINNYIGKIIFWFRNNAVSFVKCAFLSGIVGGVVMVFCYKNEITDVARKASLYFGLFAVVSYLFLMIFSKTGMDEKTVKTKLNSVGFYSVVYLIAYVIAIVLFTVSIVFSAWLFVLWFYLMFSRG